MFLGKCWLFGAELSLLDYTWKIDKGSGKFSCESPGVSCTTENKKMRNSPRQLSSGKSGGYFLHKGRGSIFISKEKKEKFKSGKTKAKEMCQVTEETWQENAIPAPITDRDDWEWNLFQSKRKK